MTIAAIGLAGAALSAGAGGWWLWRALHAPGPLTAEVTVLIPSGADPARALAEAGVISDPLVFRLAARLHGRAGALQAGEYRFAAGTRMATVLAALAEGRVMQYAITIPEGLTSHQVMQRLLAEEALTGSLETPAEGALLPETYVFRRGEARAAVVRRMQESMRAALAEAWATCPPGGALKTPQEALILASIVEKEAAYPGEYARIAGVFVNRLKRGMRLQSDPTALYAMTGGKPENDGFGPIGRRLTRADLAIDSPYNTYVVKGLPPGPIASPGRGALTAACAPEVHGYLYFVAEPGGGGHAFAKTLAEHNANAARYRAARAR